MASMRFASFGSAPCGGTPSISTGFLQRRTPFDLVRALALCLLSGAACKGNPKVSLEISLPGDVAANAAWFEVAAYKDASCAAVSPMLANGAPEGATARIAFRREDAVGPQMGDIPNGRYAFGAVAPSGAPFASIGETAAQLASL